MNLITSDVMRAMAGASSSAAQAGISMGVYRQAKAKGDKGGMDCAMGYAADSMRTASQQDQAAREALKQALIEAREQENLERRQALEDARAETRQQQDPARRKPTEEPSVQAKESNTPRIANDGPTASKTSGEGRDSDKTTQSALSQSVPQRAENPASTGALYTHLGEIRPAASKQELSVTS